MAYQVNGSRVEWNPSAARLRELTEKMPNASVTEFGNVAIKARVNARSSRSTYIVEDSTNSRGQTITRAEYDRVTARQDAHITQSHVVVVDGYIGSDPLFRTRARLIMEAANANVAGMQKQLYYPTEADYDPSTWAPDTTVIYTPNLDAPGYPDDRLIAVDLATNIVQGIVEGTISWAEDPDFGYEVADTVPGVDDQEILRPRLLYARQGRTDEYDAMVARLKRERRQFLESFGGLDSSLVKSLG